MPLNTRFLRYDFEFLMELAPDHLLSLTEQLQRFSGGDRAIAETVLRQVLPELYRIAVRALGRDREELFSPTELINEIWLRTLRKGGWQIHSRQHFYAIAALAMRQALVDFARFQKAKRRGGKQKPLSLDEHTSVSSETADPESVIQIGILMDQMELRNPESARIVDLHYFAGFTLEEIADITGMTFRQVRHRWEQGRDWLKDQLQP